MFETNVSTPSNSTEQPRNMQALCCSQITRSLRKSSKHLSYALLNYHTDTISIIKVENSNIQFEQIHNVWVPFRWYPWYLIHIEFMFSIFTERQSYLNCSSTNESNFILQKVLVSLLLQLPVIWNWFKSKPVVNNLYKKLVRKKKKKNCISPSAKRCSHCWDQMGMDVVSASRQRTQNSSIPWNPYCQFNTKTSRSVSPSIHHSSEACGIFLWRALFRSSFGS